MATSNFLDLGIRVSTAVQGLAGFDHLRASIGGVARSAGLANTNLAKLALEFGAIVLAFKGVGSITNFFKESIDAAKEARAVQERLGIALQRNPKLAARGAQFIAEQQVRLTQLADTMDRSGVLAATSLESGFAGLARAGFSPDSIERMSQGFEGIAISLRGVGATAPEVADVAKSVQLFVKTGRAGELRQFFTKEQLSNISKMKSEVQRAEFAMGWLEKQGYRVGDAMETAGGKVAIANKNWGRLKQTLGEPFIDTQLAFTEMMGELALALEPVSKEIASALTPAMQDMAKALRSPEVKQAIKDFGEGLKFAFQWIKDNWGAISKGLTAIGIAAAGLGIFSILVSPVTLAAVALAALAAGVILVIENWDKIGPALKKMGEGIAKATEGLWKPITDGLKGVSPEIKTELDSMWQDIQMFFAGDLDWDSLWEKSLVPSFGKIGEAIGKIDWGKMGAGIVDGFAKLDWPGIGSAIGKFASTALQNAFNFAKFIGASITAIDWSGIGASLASIDWSGIGSTIISGISGAFGAVGGAVSGIDWSGVAHAIGYGIGEAMKLIAWAAFILPQDIHNAFVGVVSGIDWSGVGTQLVGSLGDAANNAMAAAGWIAEMVSHIMGGIVTSLAGGDWGKVTQILVKGFTDALGGILKEVASWGPKIVQSIVSGLGGLAGAIASRVGLGSQQAVAAANTGGHTGSWQYGGLVAHPSLATIAEAGPEMVIPLNNRQRSQGLLSQTAQMLGMGGVGKGGGGPTNVNVSMPITVNGAQAGQGAEIAREIQRAMQDPIREMLEQLRAARDEEQRLSYV